MKISILRKLLLVGWIGCLPIGALAQDDLCAFGSESAWERIVLSFEGDWKMEHLEGFVQAGPMTMPYPRAPEDDMLSLVYDGEALVATVIGHPAELHFEWANEPAWEFKTESGEDKPDILSHEDLALVMGCDLTSIPRLIARTSAVVDGRQMDFTYRLMIVSDNMMFGIMHVHAATAQGIVNSWRSVTMTR